MMAMEGSVPYTCCCLIVMMTALVVHAKGGCMRSSDDMGFPDTRMAACRGRWFGHVKHADGLCAPGWKVCNWDTDGQTLAKISWNVALSVEGCYAYNAAQDGARCRECRNNLDQDDLAGIGRGCPHQQKGLSSCIGGGRIDASCCVDSHVSVNKACQQQPWIDGVMCCKQTARKPHILAPPPARMEVNVGQIFMLSCQAEGSPAPRVEWYKDGAKLSGLPDTRVSMLSSGDLLVTLAHRSDSGQYSCEVINEEGIDIAHTQVTVKDHKSGCADGTTEGLSFYKDIQACEGRWKGHVKLGKPLCRRGWRVCNSHDHNKLQDINWLDILDTKGCFAYNVGNDKMGKCRRCNSRKGQLAGLGSTCGRHRYAKPSCLAHGRIDVYKTQDSRRPDDKCAYTEGLTTGVLCCRKQKKHRKDRNKNKISTPHQYHCALGCENGGQCVGYNICLCPPGYKGAMCQNAVCLDGCGSRARCVSPGKCECIQPYKGPNCSEKLHRPSTSQCKVPCQNGGRCRHGRCKCPPSHIGSSCQYQWKNRDYLSKLNRTER